MKVRLQEASLLFASAGMIAPKQALHPHDWGLGARMMSISVVLYWLILTCYLLLLQTIIITIAIGTITIIIIVILMIVMIMMIIAISVLILCTYIHAFLWTQLLAWISCGFGIGPPGSWLNSSLSWSRSTSAAWVFGRTRRGFRHRKVGSAAISWHF